MFQFGRLNEIFEYVTHHDYTLCKTLSKKFHVTERTIRNDIQEINSQLAQNGAVIKMKRKYGYYIEITSNVLFEKFKNQFAGYETQSIELDSPKDRIKYILIQLLSTNDYISLDEIMETIFISKNTLNNYIKSIKLIADKYNLEYITKANAGIKIIGSEEDKRKCIIDNITSSSYDEYLVKFTKEEKLFFKEINLNDLRNIVLNHLHRRNIEITDYNTKNLVMHLALMIIRVQANNYINIRDIQTEKSIMSIVESICSDIEKNYDIVISRGEKYYIYLHVISNTHVEINEIDDQWLNHAIREMLYTIYENYRFDLRGDDILKEDLFRHMKSIFTSKLYNLNIRNPLLNTIKNNYPLAYEMTLTSVRKIFTKEPFILSEDDIGYVSVHIGASIERIFAKNMKKKNVILVCGSGQATTRMLEARLNLYFNDKLNIISSISYNEFINFTEDETENIDFAISTIPISDTKIPTVCVNFGLRNKDVEIISKFISSIKSKKDDDTLAKFFHEDLFFKFKEVSDKETILNILSNGMKNRQIVEDNYLDSVFEREKLGNTNMNDVFALAHPMKLCANETKVAVAILEKPLLWDKNETVQIVFLLAIKKGLQKDLEHLYDYFIEIINNTKLQQQIIESNNFEEFSKTILSIDRN